MLFGIAACPRVLACVIICSAMVHGAAAQGTPSLLAFEVTVVKPADPQASGESWKIEGGLTAIENMTLLELIRNAYLLKTSGQIVNAPEWIGEAKFDVKAKLSDAEFRKQEHLHGEESAQEYALLLQRLLAERFGLRVRMETRRLPVFALSVDGTARGLHISKGRVPGCGRHVSGGDEHWTICQITMDTLAEVFSGRYEVGRLPVVNRTGLTGAYDFELNWAPERGDGVAAGATEPGLLDALREQLGLKLRKETGDVPVVVVEQVKHPEFD